MDWSAWRRTLPGALVVCALAAGACRLEVALELPLSAIERAGTDKEVELFVHTEMRIPIPSADECADYTARIERALRKRLIEFETWGCGTEGVSSYLNANFKMPMRHMDWKEYAATRKATVNGESLVTLLATQPDDAPERTGLLLALNRPELEKMKKEMGGGWGEFLKLEEASLTVRLKNDGKEKRRFRISGAFVDDEPIPTQEVLDLPWDVMTEIRLSNVAMTSFAEFGLAPVVSVLEPESSSAGWWDRARGWVASLAGW
jgi:hypothetical protein